MSSVHRVRRILNIQESTYSMLPQNPHTKYWSIQSEQNLEYPRIYLLHAAAEPSYKILEHTECAESWISKNLPTPCCRRTLIQNIGAYRVSRILNIQESTYYMLPQNPHPKYWSIQSAQNLEYPRIYLLHAAAEPSYKILEHTECAESWISKNLPTTCCRRTLIQSIGAHRVQGTLNIQESTYTVPHSLWLLCLWSCPTWMFKDPIPHIRE